MSVPSTPSTKGLVDSLTTVGKYVKTSKYKFSDWNLKLPNKTTKNPESEFRKLSRAAQFFREGHYTTEDIKKIQESAREAKAKVKQAEKLAKETSKLAKESKKVIEKTKKVAEESKKVIDTILRKVPGSNTLGKALGTSNMLGALAIMGAQAGITAFAAWVSNFVQDTQDRINDQISADLTKANGRALANTDLIRKQQEQINRLNADIKAKTDKIYAEAAGASKNATVAREKANDALYEARQGRKIVEEKIATANKKANDALYETRAGRTKLEAEISKFSQGAVGKFQTEINITIGIIQKGLQQTNSRVDNLEKAKPTFQDKVIQTVQDSVKKVSYDLGSAVARLAQLEKLPTEVKALQSQVKTIETEHPKRWGITVTQAEVRQATIIKSTDSATRTYVERKLATVTQSQFSATEWVGRYGAKTADLVDDGVDRLQKNDEVLANGLSTTTTNFDERIKNIENQGLGLSALAIGILTTKVGDLQVDLQKTTNDLNNTKKDIDKLEIKTKEQEKVNQAAIPKLDQILRILPLIPVRAADAIRPSIPTISQIETASATGTCRTLQPGGCSRKAFDDLGNGINQNTNNQSNNLLDKLNTGANAAQLALLKVIDNKLGTQLQGGLSATFGRLWKTLQVDRIMNILILISTFHNALMLSNNVDQTLFSAIDNISKAVGFKWTDEKGEEAGFGSLVSQWTTNFFKTIFGAENYTALVTTYKKANRIYQAAANLLNSIQSIGQSTLNALEVVGSWNAKVGNALRKFGEVGEKAYGWMNPCNNPRQMWHKRSFKNSRGDLWISQPRNRLTFVSVKTSPPAKLSK